MKSSMARYEANASYFHTLMSYYGESLKVSWKPVMTGNTATSEYWLHWQVFLCMAWILFSLILASFYIWKHEGSNSRDGSAGGEIDGTLYVDQFWMPCLTDIHPLCLLLFRVVAFSLMATLLTITVVFNGSSMLYYYTQWTFMLVMIYFAFGSVFSAYGCFYFHKSYGGDKTNVLKFDHEQGSYVPPIPGGSIVSRNDGEIRTVREKAGVFGCMFQVIFQTCAGAVMLTDFVYWFIIFPFLTVKDYNLNFLMVSMHSINVVLLLIDTFLNCLHFPWFRIAYFILWTSIYVVFQWIVHACVSLWWPYPFLDLSSRLAPLWYVFVVLLHIPCYALFVFIVKGKHCLFSKYFAETYRCST